jgi:hypothetical protein
MKPSSAKQKGRLLQNWVRDKLFEAFKPWGLRAEDIKGTSMGVSGEDLQFSPFARDLIGISVECKSHKSFAVYKIYDQCVTNAKGSEPVVFLKQNGRKPLAVVDAEHYISLLKTSKEKET